MIKMSCITVIQLLEDKISNKQTDFDKLNKLSLQELYIYRDNLIIEYNEIIKSEENNVS